jgi:hypothetical protein
MPNKKKPRDAGLFLMHEAKTQRFIELKNSSLDLVFFILSSKNSIAVISSIGCSSLRVAARRGQDGRSGLTEFSL